MNPHPDSKWTHNICSVCYMREEPDRQPVVMRWNPDDAPEVCCFCKRDTMAGIYYRKDPALVHVET